MAALATPPRQKGPFNGDSDVMNTIPDPRTPSPLQRSASSGSSSPQHPDLSNEVAMLSTKLVNAINYQTNLDDTLQQTRHELEAARERIAQLEAAANQHEDMLRTGLLLRRSEVDSTMNQMRSDLEEHRKQKEAAERGKKEMEVELETLTSSLFEEANTMVAAARKETEAVERKNSQLKAQLNDTELLLASQQEQLQDLKGMMENLRSERDETETNAHISTAPSTPGADSVNKMSRIFDALPLSPNTLGDVPPDHPLRFAHLLAPVMRTDLQPYNDFADLLKSSRASTSHSRNASGSASNLSNGNSAFYVPSASSSPSLPGSFSSAANSSPRDASFNSNLPPLKDNKFFKRCLVEDIEPTLRLDLAPGLSWLARRTVIGALTAGTLVVEPFVPQSRFYGPVYSCALCGENRRNEAHGRRHRFRTSEDDSAQRYPLCEYCVGRVRATGDFVGFLRMVREGLWRAGSEEEVKSAWEESARLREKMFWARLGGGVVPVVTRGESPVVGHHRSEGLARSSSDASSRPSIRSRDESNQLEVPKPDDPFRTSQKQKRASIGTKTIERVSLEGDGTSHVHDFAASQNAPSDAAEEQPDTTTASSDQDAGTEPVRPKLERFESAETTIEGAAQTDDTAGSSQDIRAETTDPRLPSKDQQQRLSVTIPGSFE